MTVHRACLTHKEPVDGCYRCQVLVGGVEMPQTLPANNSVDKPLTYFGSVEDWEILKAENKRLKDAAAILVEVLKENAMNGSGVAKDALSAYRKAVGE